MNNSNQFEEELTPSEQEAAAKRRASLPKLRLQNNERLYVSRTDLERLHKEYFKLFDDIEQAGEVLSEELRSYMESVLFERYKSEIAELQDVAAIGGAHRRKVQEFKAEYLLPKVFRTKIFKRKKPNAAMRMCAYEAELEAEIDNATYREKISRQEEFIYGADEEKTNEAQDLAYAIIDKLTNSNHAYNLLINRSGEYITELIEEYIAIISAKLYVSPEKIRRLAYEIIEELIPGRRKRAKIVSLYSEEIIVLITKFTKGLKTKISVKSSENEINNDTTQEDLDELQELEEND